MNFPNRTDRWKPLWVALLIGMTILNLSVLWYGRNYMSRGYGDFTAFYTAAKLVQHGHAHELYDLKLQWEVQQEFASTVSIRNGPLPYIRPPFQAIIFLPLAWLNYRAAFAVWMLIKVFILLLVPFLLKPHLLDQPLLPAWIAGLLSLAVAPVAMDLLQGQDAILFLLICVLAFTAVSRGSDALSGIWLGLGLFKFHLILPIMLVLALRRKGNIVLSFLATALCLLLISAALVGWQTLLHYPQYLWSLSQQTGTGVMQAQSMPNLRGLLHMLSQAPAWQRITNWFYVPLAILGIVAAATIWPSRRVNTSRELFVAGYCFCLVSAILVSFYFSGYDMMLLILPAIVLTGPFLGSPKLPAWSKTIYVVALGFLLLIPVSWTQLLQFHLEHWDTLVLVVLAGTIAYAINIWKREIPKSLQGSAAS